MYFYVMPISPENRGSTITISSSAVSSGFRRSSKLDSKFEITEDLLSTKLVIDVDTIVISAKDPVPLINYLTITGKRYTYALYRFWSMIFPTMHKGIDVDDFIKFIKNLGDKFQIEDFFYQWTFNDYNEWLSQNPNLTKNKSLFIKQFMMINENNVKNKDELILIQSNAIKVLNKAVNEIKNWSNADDVDFDLYYQELNNGFQTINASNKPVVSVISSDNSTPLQLLLQFIATMDYFEESKALGWKRLVSFANAKPEATNSLLDLGDEIPINALPLNVKYFFPKEIWENDTHYQFFKDNVKTNIDWFFLMVAYYKGYSILSMVNALRNKNVDLLRTVDYVSIDDFKEEIEEWLEDYKEDFLPLLKTSLTSGKSNSISIDKDMLEQNKSSITVKAFKFFNKVPNNPPKPVNIDKTVYPWISITAKGIELDRKKILADSEISEDELNKYLKDNDWNKLKGKLHKQFGMVQVKNADMIETLISRLTIILFS
jgi:hypothetical protein